MGANPTDVRVSAHPTWNNNRRETWRPAERGARRRYNSETQRGIRRRHPGPVSEANKRQSSTEFEFTELLPTTTDDTPYERLDLDGVEAVDLGGERFLRVEP